MEEKQEGRRCDECSPGAKVQDFEGHREAWDDQRGMGEKPLEQSLSHNWKQRLEFGRWDRQAIRSENRKVKDVGTEQAPWITELGANP